MVGEEDIEREFYDLLATSNYDDEIDRRYRYYYGDVDMTEEDVPRRDDATSQALATLRQLNHRLGRNEERNLRLRRIELLTVRRFLETGRKPPVDVELRARVAEVPGADTRVFGDEFWQGVRAEGARVHGLLA